MAVTAGGTRTVGRLAPTVAGPSIASDTITAARTPRSACNSAESESRTASRRALLTSVLTRINPIASHPNRAAIPVASTMSAVRIQSDSPAAANDSRAVVNAVVERPNKIGVAAGCAAQICANGSSNAIASTHCQNRNR